LRENVIVVKTIIDALTMCPNCGSKEYEEDPDVG